jgi:pimeloyl-ACP methyl ester carboxylesterase
MSRSNHRSLEWSEERHRLCGIELVVLRAGQGKPLLVLHEELGHPGPLRWHEDVASRRTLLIPLHPGFGRTERVEWIGGMRDLACFYARFLREQKHAPIDVIGFSFGGWLAAEMVANDPSLFSRMILVGAAGVRPPEGEILDLFRVTAKAYLRDSVADIGATTEFASLYGGEQTPEQVEAWEDARAETARLAWAPYMFNPSLPHLLEGVRGVPALLLWGAEDRVVPQSAGQVYERSLADAKRVVFDGCGHRPEIETREAFVRELQSFLG